MQEKLLVFWWYAIAILILRGGNFLKAIFIIIYTLSAFILYNDVDNIRS